jgi:V8-like Glu-specific endopeptidase
VGALTVGVVIMVTPANGAAHDLTSFAGGFRGTPMAASRNAQVMSNGTAAVGALFSTSSGKLGSHFCTASVVHSPHGDLAITAAHCMTSSRGVIDFVPGYHAGAAPYGAWQVIKVYADTAWNSGASQNDDIAFIQLSQPGSPVPVENVTGAETLATGTSARQLVTVIGYPDTTELPIGCANWTSQPIPGQLEFDCDGYTDGTSGGPLLASVGAANGQGVVIGVIGGYQQGGLTPAVSYSSQFGPNVAALYAAAVEGS